MADGPLGWVFLLLIWGVLLGCGYVYLGLASLDPHNPARLPGPWSRAFGSCIAATSFISALALEGAAATFCASLSIGTILTPGLNDPFHPRREEEPSGFARFVTNLQHQLVGSLILKLVAVLLAWVSSLVWQPMWLPVLTVLAGFSIQARTGVLIHRGTMQDQVEADINEVFDGKLPPSLSSFAPERATAIRKLSDRRIRKLFPPPLAEKLVRAKQLENLLDWYAPPVVIPRMCATLGALVLWMGCAAAFIVTNDRISIDVTNIDGASGLLAGILVAEVLEGLRK